MRRTKFFMSVMVSALTAVAMCLSMSACGGDDNEDDEIVTPKGSAKKGVHRLEVSFSRNYAPAKDCGMYFLLLNQRLLKPISSMRMEILCLQEMRKALQLRRQSRACIIQQTTASRLG